MRKWWKPWKTWALKSASPSTKVLITIVGHRHFLSPICCPGYLAIKNDNCRPVACWRTCRIFEKTGWLFLFLGSLANLASIKKMEVIKMALSTSPLSILLFDFLLMFDHINKFMLVWHCHPEVWWNPPFNHFFFKLGLRNIYRYSLELFNIQVIISVRIFP